MDVVIAIETDSTKHPVFQMVERRGGHRTIHLVLLESGKPRQDEILAKLNSLGATYEGANQVLFAIDFTPTTDWQPALDYLTALESEECLEYRTSAY